MRHRLTPCESGTIRYRLESIPTRISLIEREPRRKPQDPGRVGQGFAREANMILVGREANKIVPSLVFRQVPTDEKAAGLAAWHEFADPASSPRQCVIGAAPTAKKRAIRILRKYDHPDVPVRPIAVAVPPATEAPG